jgi:glutamate dehydrogenase
VTRWLLGLARVLERTAVWVLTNVPPQTSPSAAVDMHLEGLATLRDAFGDFVAGEERTTFEKRVMEIRDLGADEAFSRRLITLRFLDQLLEILAIARHLDADPIDVAKAYYRASEILCIPWLRQRMLAAGRHGQWEHRAVQILSEDLSRAHREITAHMLRDDHVESSKEFTRHSTSVLEELRRDEQSVGVPALTVAVHELATLAERLGANGVPGRRR